jgi:hypothetical protein
MSKPLSHKYRAFYDRKKGLFTIQDNLGNPVFKQLVARSGASRYQGTSWTRGKSPIPFSHELAGQYWLWTKVAGPEYGPPSKAGGIGRFYHISTEEDRVTTLGKRAGQVRIALGWHFDNNWIARLVNKVFRWVHVGDGWKGSAGCVVSAVDTPKQREQGEAAFDFLDGLHAAGIERLPLTVL